METPKRRPFGEGWIKNNIFDSKIGDAIAYFVFYMIIPVIISVISLVVVSSGHDDIIYCYLTILVSSLNCIYDAMNRRTEQKTVRNAKLYLIVLANVFVGGYCLFEILYVLIAGSTARCDIFLFAYLLVIVIGLVDVVYCFAKESTFVEYYAIENAK